MKAVRIALLALTLAACDGSRSLPPAPDTSTGKFQDKTGGFSTDKMLAMCTTASTAETGGFTDSQVVNGVCEMTAMSVELIGRSADPGQVCVQASRNLALEFKRRFPSHSLMETAGRC